MIDPADRAWLESFVVSRLEPVEQRIRQLQGRTARRAQRASTAGPFSGGGVGAVPAFAQSFAVEPGEYLVAMQFSGWSVAVGALAFWLDYQLPGGALTQGNAATFYFNNAGVHDVLPMVSQVLTVEQAGTLKLWPNWGGSSDVNDRLDFLVIPA